MTITEPSKPTLSFKQYWNFIEVESHKIINRHLPRKEIALRLIQIIKKINSLKPGQKLRFKNDGFVEIDSTDSVIRDTLRKTRGVFALFTKNQSEKDDLGNLRYLEKAVRALTAINSFTFPLELNKRLISTWKQPEGFNHYKNTYVSQDRKHEIVKGLFDTIDSFLNKVNKQTKTQYGETITEHFKGWQAGQSLVENLFYDLRDNIPQYKRLRKHLELDESKEKILSAYIRQALLSGEAVQTQDIIKHFITNQQSELKDKDVSRKYVRRIFRSFISQNPNHFPQLSTLDSRVFYPV